MRCLRNCFRTVDSVFGHRNLAIARQPQSHVLLVCNRRRASARFESQCSNYPVYGHGIIIVRNVHGVSAFLLPPVVFAGLLVALWTWKCFMMIIFQNKIIYMPGLPPNACRETISDYVAQCSGITWREERIRASDGTEIALCVTTVENKAASTGAPFPIEKLIIYFQGNASSLPSRLPFLSSILRTLRDDDSIRQPVRYTAVCVSYRGYWTSKGSPSENGLERDAEGALAWALSQYSTKGHPLSQRLELILWGQSIGAGVASNLAAKVSGTLAKEVELKTLILETPFTNVRDMLVALYPQKWLPYRYLWPFLWNHLDSLAAIDKLALHAHAPKPAVVIVDGGKDELVPKWHGDALEKRCLDLGLDVQRHIVSGALHTEVMMRPEGRNVLSNAIRTLSR